MDIGQLRLQFCRATGMISGLGVPFLLEAPLRHHDVSLPRVRVFGEIVLPKTLTRGRLDRKSTRLNSSHPSISYAVFCLKKKKCSDAGSLPALPPCPGSL